MSNLSRTSTPRAGALRLLVPLFVTAIALCGQLESEARADRSDRLSELARTLTKSKHEKARIAAAVSLGRLRDKRALPALVKALRDSSTVVRAVAATSLGYLGDRRALPALRRATRDSDRSVRRRATRAIARIRKSSSQRSRKKPRRRPRRRGGDNPAKYRISAKERPRLQPKQPRVYVKVKSSSDESRGKARKKTRRRRARYVRALMMHELRRNTSVTLEKQIADEHEITPYTIDLSIDKLDRLVRGAFIEIRCEIRIAISNGRGKMISFLTGGAKVQVPRTTFRRQYEPQLQREAMENAVKSVHQDLIAFLRRKPE